jgi:uncharacterized glyoxalase superfamily protein PhnB
MKQPQLRESHPVIMVRNVGASIEFYARLGFERIFGGTEEDPSYAGIRRDSVELHVQWHDASQWKYDIDRPTYRFVVDDVDALYADFGAQGLLQQMTDVQDTSWGTREFHLHDPDGNGLQFYQDS